MKIPEGWKLVPVEPTADMRVAYYDCVPPQFTAGAAIQKWKAMLAAAPTPPEQDEPVAYGAMHSSSSKLALVIGIHKGAILDWIGDNEGYAPIAFYTRPQSNKLRVAAEEVIDRFYNAKCDGELEQSVIDLRAALEEK